MRQDCTPTWIDGQGRYHSLRRVRLGVRDLSESFLQETLHACPDAKYPDCLSRNVRVEELEPVLDEFVERLSETIEAIRGSVG